MSYGFTKSFALSLFCKFHPAFNTSPTVAALLTTLAKSAALGVVCSFVGVFTGVKAPVGSLTGFPSASNSLSPLL